jgi:maltose alpha-D-glucosyltransferase/alpha-amylase
VPGEDEVGAYVSDLVTLARRTAELHLALASDGEDPAFAPEPIGADEIRLVEARARGVIDLLAAEQAGVDPAVRPDVQWLIDHRAALETKIAVATRVGQAGMKCRTHGDYHLGQVLHAEGDAVILDFEGEPGRSLEERRGKQSPLRDVAGMLRSFEYAGYAALFAFTEARPDDFKVLEPWTQGWAARAAAVFVRTYLERAKGAPFLPAGNEDVKAMLELFLTEKALYELKYELNNRPGWSRIPLRGLRAIVAVDSPPPATTV